MEKDLKDMSEEEIKEASKKLNVKEKDINYDGLYFLGVKKGKEKYQFLHVQKVKGKVKGYAMQNGINKNILILEVDNKESDDFFDKLSESRFKNLNLQKFMINDVLDANKRNTNGKK